MILGSVTKNKATVKSGHISKLEIDTTHLKQYGVAKAVVKELYRIDGGFKVKLFVCLDFKNELIIY